MEPRKSPIGFIKGIAIVWVWLFLMTCGASLAIAAQLPFLASFVGDTSNYADGISVQLNRGKPLIAYRRTNDTLLKLATCVDDCYTLSPIWVDVTVDANARPGSFTDLQLNQDKPAIAFADQTNDRVKVAICINICDSINAAWRSLTIPNSQNAAELSLAFHQDRPIVTFRDFSTSSPALKIAVCMQFCADAFNSQWSVRTIDAAGIPGRNSTVKIVNGVPVVTYYDDALKDLKYAVCTQNCLTDSAAWSITTIDSTGDVGSQSSMLVVNGVPMVAYYDATNQDLKLAVCTGGCFTAQPTWQISTLDSGGDVGQQPSLRAINNKVSIGYFDATNQTTKLARCADSCTSASAIWQFDSAAVQAGVTSANGKIAIGEDMPILAYQDGNALRLRYATPGVAPTIVDASQIDVNHTSLRLHNGKPVVSYYDATNLDLKLATCVGDCSNTAGWRVVTVDSAGDVGQFSSLQLNAGNPVIAYHDATNRRIKLATCLSQCQSDTPNWKITSIPVPINVNVAGPYLSLALNAGNPVVAYFSRLLGNGTVLNLAACTQNCQADNALWKTSMADSGAGSFPSLQLANGIPVLGYANRLTSDPSNKGTAAVTMCTANCLTDTSTWSAPAIQSSSNNNIQMALTLKSDGNYMISYRDISAGFLHISNCLGGCYGASTDSRTARVDVIASNDFLSAPALQLVRDTPVLNYSSYLQGHLKLARCAKDCDTNYPLWSRTSLDGAGTGNNSIGQGNSMQIQDNTIMAAYAGLGGKQLKFVSAPLPPIVPDAPLSVTAAAANAEILLTFTPPASDGGAAIIDYLASCNSQNVVGNTSPIRITGLANGTPYSCTVVARNRIGTGTISTAVSATPQSLAMTGVRSRKTH